jgi:hypothetical protein
MFTVSCLASLSKKEKGTILFISIRRRGRSNRLNYGTDSHHAFSRVSSSTNTDFTLETICSISIRTSKDPRGNVGPEYSECWPASSVHDGQITDANSSQKRYGKRGVNGEYGSIKNLIFLDHRLSCDGLAGDAGSNFGLLGVNSTFLLCESVTSKQYKTLQNHQQGFPSHFLRDPLNF